MLSKFRETNTILKIAKFFLTIATVEHSKHVLKNKAGFGIPLAFFCSVQCVWKRVVQSIAFDELNVLVCNRNASCASGSVRRSGLEEAKASAEEELASTKTTLADDEKY